MFFFCNFMIQSRNSLHIREKFDTRAFSNIFENLFIFVFGINSSIEIKVKMIHHKTENTKKLSQKNLYK